MFKILLAIFIILGMYGIYVFARIKHIVNEAGNTAITHTDAAFGTGPEIRYIAAGDSTAVGIGSQTSDDAYPNIIANALSRSNYVVYKNVAVSGAKTTEFIETQLQQIIDFKPDIITISIGANDQTHLIKNRSVFKNLQFIADRLIKETDAKIYTADIPDFSGVTLLPSWYVKLIEFRTTKFNEQIQTLASDRITIVPIHSLGTVELSKDQFHPNKNGYKAWAHTFIDLIVRR